MDYPTLVYRRWTGPRKYICEAEYKGIHSEEEHLAALADGWFDSVPEALAPAQQPDTSRAEPQETAPGNVFPTPDQVQAKVEHSAHLESLGRNPDVLTRAELEERARGLGIKIDGRWSDARLRMTIDKALGHELD